MKQLFLFVAGFLLAGAPAAARPGTPAQAADELFAQMTPDRPGAVAIVARGDEILYANAFGSADGEQRTPITLSTRFHVASVSKQFTAMAVALLAQDGRMNLNEDIRTYLPELPDLGARITVADLLHHTSGLRDQWDLLILSGTDIESLLTQGAILNLVRAQRELNFVPGSEFRYSNTGYTLAAEIVARRSGMPFRQFVQERIFAPLGMDDSLIYDDAGELVPGRAQSYQVMPDGTVRLRRLNYSNYGATSLFTTAGDLLKWSRELLDPKVFDPALIRSLSEPRTLADGTVSNYGLGLFRGRVRGREAVMHGGGDAGFRAMLASYPDEDASIIILSNGAANTGDLHEGLVEIFLGGEVLPPGDRGSDPERLKKLAGTYANDWGRTLELEFADGRLIRSAGGLRQPAMILADGTLEFTAPSIRLRPVGAETDGSAILEEESVAGPPLRYRRIERQPVTAADLESIAGRYRSEELDITYTIKLDGDRLMLSSLRWTDELPLIAIRPDWFDFPRGRVNVTRDADGRVAGIAVTTGRVRNLQFQRVD